MSDETRRHDVSPDGRSDRSDDVADVRAVAAAEGLQDADVVREDLLDGTTQYTVQAPPPRDTTRPGRLLLLALAAAAVAGLVSLVTGLTGRTQWQATALGIALLLVSVALATAASRLLPHERTLQRRRHREAAATTGTGGREGPRPTPVSRRSLLALAGAAVVAVAAAVLVPLRGLGPRPGDALRVTPWGPGVRAVDIEGQPVRAADVPLAGVVTVFPEGHLDAAEAQTLLLRVPVDQMSSSTRAIAHVEGLLAYSKVCTHAGCPVGQFQADDRPPATTYRLLCPCHQSLFETTDDARPLSGPATRALPRLPIGTDEDGVVVALGDFDAPVGPGWWSM